MLKIRGVKTSIPPAGDGTPSKKLSFHEGAWPVLILNLASQCYTNHINKT